MRHEIHGEPADLAEAVETARAALACDPPESARPVLASTLAGLYLGRYECDGDLDDLRSAIEVARAGGGTAPRLERAALLVIRAVALDRYAEHVHAPGMRDEAAALLAKAARLLPRGSAELATCLSALGQTHLTRFRDTAAPADLLAARDAFARALRNLGQAAPRAALVRSSMGTAELALAGSACWFQRRGRRPRAAGRGGSKGPPAPGSGPSCWLTSPPGERHSTGGRATARACRRA